MLDIKFVRENPDVVKENIKKKFQDQKLPLVDEVVALDKEYRESRQQADGLAEFQVLHLAHEANHVPARVAAKAVVELFFAIYGKGGGFFAMEGTKPPELSALFLQGNVGGDQLDDIVFLPHLFDEAIRKESGHVSRSF